MMKNFFLLTIFGLLFSCKSDTNVQSDITDENQRFLDNCETVQAYLDESPDTDVAEGLVDLINLMAEADDEVTDEEAMAVSEFTGMISHYVSSEKGGEVQMFEVNIVPQNKEQTDAVRELLRELNIVQDRGGNVF